MQIVPRFISTDADGNDEREFLDDEARSEEIGRLQQQIGQNCN